MILYFVRHGQTEGNIERRYIGRTDEPLCDAGRAGLRNTNWPPVKMVISSPMRRCVETAEILYPGQLPLIVHDFRECDFGLFEGMNYQELNGSVEYQKWIDSGGTLPFPDGEGMAAFSLRCTDAFTYVMKTYLADEIDAAALVVHGGTIMAIMEKYAVPVKSYYDYQVKNGSGFSMVWDGVNLQHILQ